jgi:chemotaxis protein methyltransferase CheR
MSFNRELTNSFQHAIAEYTGIFIREQDKDSLAKKILCRMQDLKLASPEEYYKLLMAKDLKSRQEWEIFFSLLTNNESYFFRDEQQIKLLRDRIFPELIDRNQNTKTLRICSSGCSTGEEPYSLAILMKELIPDLWQWNVTILGIDIDRHALTEAKKGIYGSWSFRGVSQSIQQQYFQMINDRYHLSPEIKNMVQFQSVNLVRDVFPQTHTELREMDLIICRNVFIYFDKEAIANVLEKLDRTLKPLGYLLTGHTELGEQNLNRFEAKVFPESIIYQRPKDDVNKNNLLLEQNKITSSLQTEKLLKNNIQAFSIDVKNSSILPIARQENLKIEEKLKRGNEQHLLQQAEELLANKKYELALQKTAQILAITKTFCPAYCLMAKIHAKLNAYPEATKYCQQAIERDSFAVTPHYLLAEIAKKQRNLAEAKKIFKKIIYLEPTSVGAYIDLSDLYQQEGDLEKSIKMQREAIDLLKRLPPHTKIPEKDNITAAALILSLNFF